mmetsp:Transcript_34042/g.82553  ORF Transcript_34042/g.82553 Transcript_34042/m.82553 type:complete len:211 (+) Transcript_34042:729-1361(+)
MGCRGNVIGTCTQNHKVQSTTATIAIDVFILYNIPRIIPCVPRSRLQVPGCIVVIRIIGLDTTFSFGYRHLRNLSKHDIGSIAHQHVGCSNFLIRKSSPNASSKHFIKVVLTIAVQGHCFVVKTSALTNAHHIHGRLPIRLIFLIVHFGHFRNFHAFSIVLTVARRPSHKHCLFIHHKGSLIVRTLGRQGRLVGNGRRNLNGWWKGRTSW